MKYNRSEQNRVKLGTIYIQYIYIYNTVQKDTLQCSRVEYDTYSRVIQFTMVNHNGRVSMKQALLTKPNGHQQNSKN